MQMRQIGIWREQRITTGPDSGIYAEACTLPCGLARYAKISYAAIEDADIQRLSCGEAIDFPLDLNELAVRWDVA